jgi:hypothetical protein
MHFFMIILKQKGKMKLKLLLCIIFHVHCEHVSSAICCYSYFCLSSVNFAVVLLVLPICKSLDIFI